MKWVSEGIYIYIYIIMQRVKARAIPCPYQPPSRVITQFRLLKVVKPLLVLPSRFCRPDRVLKEMYIYIYIYTPDQIKQTLHWTFVHLHFSVVCDLKMRLLSDVDVIATVSWYCIITQEWWFRVHFIHVEIHTISIIYSVRYPSVLYFLCVTAPRHSRQMSYIILLKDDICWYMGPLRWVVSKRKASG